ncbi:MAG: hypothetical protein AAFZ07_25760 [Actinomycetota bacterium]
MHELSTSGFTACDPTRITPNPQGDLVCGRLLDEDQEREIAEDECERRQGVMSPAPDGWLYCELSDEIVPLEFDAFDLCSDPAALVLPDMCFDDVALPEDLIEEFEPEPLPLPKTDLDGLAPGVTVPPQIIRNTRP